MVKWRRFCEVCLVGDCRLVLLPPFFCDGVKKSTKKIGKDGFFSIVISSSLYSFQDLYRKS